MLRFFYTVSKEITLIMSTITFLTPIIVGILGASKKKWYVVGLSAVLCVSLIAIHSEMQEYTMIPKNLVGNTYKNVTEVLEEAELGWNLPQSDSIAIDSQTVVGIEESEGTVVPKNTILHLYYDAAVTSSAQVAENESGENADSDGSNLTTDTLDLELTIDSAEVFLDGFHYEFPDPNNPEQTLYIDFDKGLYGTYHYSRTLSEEELAEWGHGGTIYDENMNEIQGGLYWSDSEGNFAMQFPDNLSSGTYVYKLYHVIEGQLISSSIKFSF